MDNIQNPKFQTSCKFCFQCSHWKDSNDNGIGICTNPESPYNGISTHAMAKTDCVMQTEHPKYAIRIKQWTPKQQAYEESVIYQNEHDQSVQILKSLAMDTIEANREVSIVDYPNEDSILITRQSDELLLLSADIKPNETENE